MASSRTILVVLLLATANVLLHMMDTPKVREVGSPYVDLSCTKTSYSHPSHLRAEQFKQQRDELSSILNSVMRSFGQESCEMIRAEQFKQQRDKLSSILNFVMRSFGQESCEMIALKNKTGQTTSKVSKHGGWCAKQSSESGGKHFWDKGLNSALSRFFYKKTVGSFGDGPGRYSKEINALGEVKSYTAYDGAPFCENVTGGVVKFLDLTVPHYGLPAYDWVMSLEVGEHIPAKYEDIYLDNLVRHAREGVVLSWATIGQGGFSHVNNKELKDVVAQMAKRGFSFNELDGKPLRDASKYYWLRNNIHVYRRLNPESFQEDST